MSKAQTIIDRDGTKLTNADLILIGSRAIELLLLLSGELHDIDPRSESLQLTAEFLRKRRCREFWGVLRKAANDRKARHIKAQAP